CSSCSEGMAAKAGSIERDRDRSMVEVAMIVTAAIAKTNVERIIRGVSALHPRVGSARLQYGSSGPAHFTAMCPGTGYRSESDVVISDDRDRTADRVSAARRKNGAASRGGPARYKTPTRSRLRRSADRTLAILS